MFVVMSKFVVANNMEQQVKESFIKRPHLVDDAPGFIRMEVMNPIDTPDEFLLVTYWENQACWKDWYRGHKYKDAHKGIPKGLKLIPKTTEINYFELFAN